ncbi:hypothetical protein U1Q18_033515 [Sarracenia purpurea var. burkii]
MECFTEPGAAREALRGGARARQWRPTMDGMVGAEVDARWWPKQRRRGRGFRRRWRVNLSMAQTERGCRRCGFALVRWFEAVTDGGWLRRW